MFYFLKQFKKYTIFRFKLWEKICNNKILVNKILSYWKFENDKLYSFHLIIKF
jgi:hypothetical protein